MSWARSPTVIAEVATTVRDLSWERDLSAVPVAKDLGVFIDKTLSYNEHISKTVSSCLYKLTQINRIKYLLDKKNILLVLNAFIFSRLFYCSTVWSNTCKFNLKKLQLVQNFAARLILGLRKFDHISEGLKSLKWLNVKDRLFLNDAVMVHRYLQDNAPEYLKEKFVKRQEVSGRKTRHSAALNLPLCRLTKGQRSFTYRGAKLFDSLPDDLKTVPCSSVFKQRLRNYLQHHSKQ